MKKIILIILSITTTLSSAEIEQKKIKTINDIPQNLLVINERNFENELNLKDLELSSIKGIENLEVIFQGRKKLLSTIPDLALDLANNKLAEIPESISMLNLVRLVITNNQLVTLPDSIIELTNLMTLRAQDNQLAYIPERIGQLDYLKELELGCNKLKTLPGSIGNLKMLKQLGLAGNEFTEIPDSLSTATNLTRLNLACNPLCKLSDNLHTLSRLEILNISYTPLAIELASGLHPKVEDLWVKKLGYAFYREPHSAIASIPERRLIVKTLTYEQEIDLSSLGLKSIDDFDKLVLIHLYKNTTAKDLLAHYTLHLKLNNNNLDKLPDSFYCANYILRLDISHNKFTILPAAITKLTSLTALDMSNNELTTLPNSIESLCDLSFLDISNNQLTNLPLGLIRLNKLNVLRLFANHFSIRPIIDLVDEQEIVIGLGYIDNLGKTNLKINAFLTQLYKKGVLAWYNLEQSQRRQALNHSLWNLSQDVMREINTYL